MDRDATHQRGDEDASDADTVEMSKPSLETWLESPTDRRRDTRLLQQVSVTGRYGQHFISCTSADVSENGVFLRTSHPPPIGAYVTLGFAAGQGSPVIAEGHVRWVKTETDGRPVGFGVALTAEIASTLKPH